MLLFVCIAMGATGGGGSVSYSPHGADVYSTPQRGLVPAVRRLRTHCHRFPGSRVQFCLMYKHDESDETGTERRHKISISLPTPAWHRDSATRLSVLQLRQLGCVKVRSAESSTGQCVDITGQCAFFLLLIFFTPLYYCFHACRVIGSTRHLSERAALSNQNPKTKNPPKKKEEKKLHLLPSTRVCLHR